MRERFLLKYDTFPHKYQLIYTWYPVVVQWYVRGTHNSINASLYKQIFSVDVNKIWFYPFCTENHETQGIWVSCPVLLLFFFFFLLGHILRNRNSWNIFSTFHLFLKTWITVFKTVLFDYLLTSKGRIFLHSWKFWFASDFFNLIRHNF